MPHEKGDLAHFNAVQDCIHISSCIDLFFKHWREPQGMNMDTLEFDQSKKVGKMEFCHGSREILRLRHLSSISPLYVCI